MSRGKHAKVGQETVSQNGYRYVKTPTGWKAKHHLVAEEKLGRTLKKGERVSFANGDREDFRPENIVVSPTQTNSSRRIATLHQRLEEMMYEFVNCHDEPIEALDSLKDLLSDVRLEHGFQRL